MARGYVDRLPKVNSNSPDDAARKRNYISRSKVPRLSPVKQPAKLQTDKLRVAASAVRRSASVAALVQEAPTKKVPFQLPPGVTVRRSPPKLPPVASSKRPPPVNLPPLPQPCMNCECCEYIRAIQPLLGEVYQRQLEMSKLMQSSARK